MKGFSLVEFIIVISIIAFISAMSYFGLRESQNAESVKKASKQVLLELISMQNRVNSGAASTTGAVDTIGDPIAHSFGVASFGDSQKFYSLDTTRIDLPSGVAITLADDGGPLQNSGVYVCFIHPSLITVNPLGSLCKCNGIFACKSSNIGYVGLAGKLKVILNGPTGTPSRSVYVEGSGMFVTRIYEQKD